MTEISPPQAAGLEPERKGGLLAGFSLILHLLNQNYCATLARSQQVLHWVRRTRARLALSAGTAKTNQARVFVPAGGFLGHRDMVGASNILSRTTLYGKLGQIVPCNASLVEVPNTIKYRQPFGRVEKREIQCLPCGGIEWTFTREREGKRSPLDTGQVASAGVVALHTR